jgi:hypothetical protein
MCGGAFPIQTIGTLVGDITKENAPGGQAGTPNPYGFTAPTGAAGMALENWYNPRTGQEWTAGSGGYIPPSADWYRVTGLDRSQYPTAYSQPPRAETGYTPVPTNAPRFLPSAPIEPGTPSANASQIDASIRPFLTEGLRQAQELFLRQQPSMFPGQTYVSPSEQTMQALQQQENIARAPSIPLDVAQGAYLQSLGGLSQTAAGGFLQGNPYQAAMMEAATRPLTQQFSQTVLPGISSLYSRSGRLGSGAMERALGTASEQYGRALGDITANIAGTQYQQERGLQQQAALQLANLAQAAPQIYGQQFLPSQTLAQVGAQREAIAAQPLQEQMTRYAYEQRLPYEQLSGYLSSVYGSPLGSFGTPAPQPQYSPNRTVGALGGALAGGLGGYALGQAFPSLGFGGGYGLPALGAIGGGLLGGGFF